MSDPSGWHRPLTPVQTVVHAQPEQKNNPLALVAIFGMVLIGVLVIALGGQAASGSLFTSEVVAGVAVPVGGQVVRPGEEAQAALDEASGNRLTSPGAALAEVTCDLPDLREDAPGLTSYYEAGVRCLDEAWAPALGAAGKPARTPKLTVEEGGFSGCGFAPGEEDAVAFYCSADEVITMPRERLLEDAGDVEGVHLAILAHEYGHHVQALSGILDTAERREGFAVPSEARELSRRVELQANCFAGLFIAAAEDRGDITAEVAEMAVKSFGFVVGSDTHGSVRNQERWGEQGYGGESTSACDTWSANASEVA